MRIKKALLLTIALCLLLPALRSQTYTDTDIISVEKLKGMDLDLLMAWKGRIYIIAHHGRDDISKIEKARIPFAIETHNFYPYSSHDVFIQSGVNGDYHTYSELERDLLALEESRPGLARLYDIGDSLEGRNIYALKISDNVSVEEDEPEVLFIGCHHAREWISVEVPYLLAEHLVDHYETNARIRGLVDHSQIWIVPLLNPDGLEYSIYFYRYWRKNRRDNGDGSYGVDPNRNYDYMWGFDDEGSSPNTFSEVYRGTAPFSEPETQAVRDFFLQRNFRALISYHNYSQVILYPWGYTDQPSPKEDLLFEMAANMSGLMQSVSGRVYEFGGAAAQLYLTNGDTTDWALGVYDIPAFTFELPPVDQLHGGFFNAEADIPSIFQENLPAALYLIEWAVQNHESEIPWQGQDKNQDKEFHRIKRGRAKVPSITKK
jgi:murein tripeptide amidase MpaA